MKQKLADETAIEFVVYVDALVPGKRPGRSTYCRAPITEEDLQEVKGNPSAFRDLIRTKLQMSLFEAVDLLVRDPENPISKIIKGAL